MTSFLSRWCVCAWLALPGILRAQVVRCRVDRINNVTFVGPCVRDADTVAQLTLRAPTSDSRLWRGVGYLRWRGQQEPLAVDATADGGTFRTGTQWFDVLSSSKSADQMSFKFAFDHPSSATAIDVQILRLARSLVADSAHWNPADERDAASEPAKGFSCPRSERRTLFCALYDASVRIAGEYWHGRPAVNAVRQAIGVASPTRLRHPLTDFNNAPGTDLHAVHRVFDRALAQLEAQLRDHGGRSG